LWLPWDDLPHWQAGRFLVYPDRPG